MVQGLAAVFGEVVGCFLGALIFVVREAVLVVVQVGTAVGVFEGVEVLFEERTGVGASGQSVSVFVWQGGKPGKMQAGCYGWLGVAGEATSYVQPQTVIATEGEIDPDSQSHGP